MHLIRRVINKSSRCRSVTMIQNQDSRNRIQNISSDSDHTSNGWTEISIPVPWGHIAGKTYGDPKGKPVLAVHGILDNSGTFDRLVPLLSKSLYIVAIDLPGHGLSSHVPLGFSYHYTDMVLTIRRITNHFEWTTFSWLGHSLGSGLGVFYSSIFPSHKNMFMYLQKQETFKLSSLKTLENEQPLVDRIVMIDLIFPVTGARGKNLANKISLALDQFLSIEEKMKLTLEPSYEINEAVKRLIKGTNNSLNEETARIILKRGTTFKEQKYALNRDFRLRGGPYSMFVGIPDKELYEILSHIRSSILFIKAKNSTWYWEPEIYEHVLNIYKNNSPDFQFEEVEGNHFIHLNEPEKIANMINKFLLEKNS